MEESDNADKIKSTTAKAGERYNPNDEKRIPEQVAVANWELLRRNPEFKAVVGKWIHSEDFRNQHSTKEASYNYNAPARCALDWMLGPQERHILALHQIATFKFKYTPSDNYGPIAVEVDQEAYTDSLRKRIHRMCRVRPLREYRKRLRIDQCWLATPEPFRVQFRRVVDEPPLGEIKLQDESDRLMKFGDYLVSEKPLLPEERKWLGRYLFQFGHHLSETSRTYRLAAIPRVVYTERHLDEILNRIKQRIPFVPRTGYDQDSKKSFLGTRDQWEKFLAWEAHGENAYQAAAEFLPSICPKPGKAGHLHGGRSRSEYQRDTAASVRNAVKAIQKWYPRLYPKRDLRPEALKT